MNSKDLEINLRSIHDLIVIDEDIVTYKQLSVTLNIHTNIAKKLLFIFITSKSYDRLELLVTYLISGVLRDGKGYFVTVVKQDEVDKIKSKLEIVSSEHIYSVQKKQNSVSFNTLYIKELDTPQHFASINNLSSIQCYSNLVKTDLQISELRKKAYGYDTHNIKLLNTDKITNNKSGSLPLKPPLPNKPIVDDKLNVQIRDITSEVENTKVLKSDTIVSNKGQEKKSNKRGVIAKNSKKGNVIAKNSPVLTSFFNKVSFDKHSEPVVSTKIDSIVARTDNSSNRYLKKDPVVENNIKKDLKSKVLPSKKIDAKKLKNKKQKKTEKQVRDKKKRNRIVLPSSSESSNGDESECEEPLPNEPEPEVTPAEPSEDEDIVLATPEITRKRKRRLVNKTYTDDEGYVLTKKEYAFESVSDSEVVEEPPKKETKKNALVEFQPVAVCSPKKTKQASIMNFFTKK